MILFFGTRQGPREHIVLKNVKCPYCAQKGTLTLFKISNYVHLFWIRIFKINTQLFAECSHCKRYYDATEFTDEIKEASKRWTD
ncbi:zinc-ribbon domain-containing protein [Arenibacter sp. GZD96]|uniref:zinc-ribbon domain-containing protein n=1 Tax=Aurantibrevibacter litoralis TaxID=3106030 RepID=UPI002B031B42|nr:zinc-ribbon domain-containing protein [Arenibacter sp. GZD-96]MEA1786755.1 zinc-ribbon domain-containing protein [Arenibacter sp. GZD-96]